MPYNAVAAVVTVGICRHFHRSRVGLGISIHSHIWYRMKIEKWRWRRYKWERECNLVIIQWHIVVCWGLRRSILEHKTPAHSPSVIVFYVFPITTCVSLNNIIANLGYRMPSNPYDLLFFCEIYTRKINIILCGWWKIRWKIFIATKRCWGYYACINIAFYCANGNASFMYWFRNVVNSSTNPTITSRCKCAMQKNQITKFHTFIYGYIWIIAWSFIFINLGYRMLSGVLGYFHQPAK